VIHLGLSVALVSVRAMASIRHEGFVEMFRQRPELAAVVLRDGFGLRLPAYVQVRVDSADLSEPDPLERRADAVAAFAGRAGGAVLAVVVEVQLRPKEDKQFSWPYYVAKLRARLRCPVMLLVVTPHAATARKCAAGIEMGHPGWVLRPLVYGPDRAPVLTDDAAAAGMPELAMVSAMMHGSHPQCARILDTLQVALAGADEDLAVKYAEIVFAVLPRAARRYWEELMSTQAFPFQSAYARRLMAKGRAEGEAKGRAEGEAKGVAKGEATSVLEVLDARGFEVPKQVRARIVACSDIGQLKIWVRRAATVSTIDELFDQ
jgi:hypothetical protein